MEVRPGYKRTEISVIPEDWEVKTLDEICLKIQDGTHFSPSLGGNDNLYVTSKSIGFGILNVSNAERISTSQHKAIYSRCDVKKGDLLLTKDGANTGNAALNHLDEEISLLSSVAFLRFDPRRHIAAYYLQQVLSSDGQRRIKELMTGNAITRLTLEIIRDIRFSVPSLPEQRAIAAVLSDVDALITALDKLIAKKRDIKKAAMQQLLTGKKRLPGFSGEWEVKKLGDVADIVSGGTPSTTVANYWDGGIDWCTPTDITRTPGKYLTHTEKRISEAGLRNSSANLLPIGALLLCSRATIGEVKIATGVVSTNQGFKSLVCRERVSSEFLYYTLLTMKPDLIERATGSTFLEISKKDTVSIEIHVPQLSEQKAIAAVLSDMDAEIDALERRRDKTHALKQGMMQELLTGRIRLI